MLLLLALLVVASSSGGGDESSYDGTSTRLSALHQFINSHLAVEPGERFRASLIVVPGNDASARARARKADTKVMTLQSAYHIAETFATLSLVRRRRCRHCLRLPASVFWQSH